MNIEYFTAASSLSSVIWGWLNESRFRIVRFDLGDRTAEEWFLIRRICGDRFIGTNGRDRGATGPYNFRLNDACNPIYLIEVIGDIARHWICGSHLVNNGRDNLPRAEVIDEIDIPQTIDSLVNLGEQPSDMTFPDFFDLQLKCAVHISPQGPARQANVFHRAMAALQLDSI